MDARIPVRVSDCRCPETPHADGDFVYLSPTVPLKMGLAADRVMASIRDKIAAGMPVTEVEVETEDALVELFVRHGALDWNLQYVNGHGVPEPRPFDVNAVLADWSIARAVAEEADRLYGTTVMAPFQEAAQRLSQPGPTAVSTSPTPSTRSPQKRSSRTTTAGRRSRTSR